MTDSKDNSLPSDSQHTEVSGELSRDLSLFHVTMMGLGMMIGAGVFLGMGFSIGKAGPGGLVLAGHTDTVPFDEGRWRSDPLGLSERDQRLYGLGSTDMKGFFPLAIAAAEAFRDTPLQQPLILLATADEESSMNGARALAAAGRPKARAAIIGEPTSLVPVRMHKGIMLEAVRVTGRPGHSSNPELGNSALEAMHAVMGDRSGLGEALVLLGDVHRDRGRVDLALHSYRRAGRVFREIGREIDCCADHGLKFWSFCWYVPGSDTSAAGRWVLAGYGRVKFFFYSGGHAVR